MVTMEQQRGSSAKVETAEVLTGIKSLSLFGAYDPGYVRACAATGAAMGWALRGGRGQQPPVYGV